MRRLDDLQNLPPDLPWPVVTVGTFDGVHVGHQCVLSEVVRWRRERSGTAVAVTFEQPPRSVLTGENPPLLTSLPHRLLLLERLGLDVCLVLQFTRELAETPAVDFVGRVLVEGLGAHGVVMGHGSTFGRGREGDERFLRERAREFGFEVRSVPPVVVDGEVVSSTRIRTALLEGDLDLTARLLGRPFSVYGTVVPGSGRGRRMGFPTTNLDLHHEVVPRDGVYVARAVLDDEVCPALASVGSRPTFTEPRGEVPAEPVVELHLIDFDGELYGRDIEAQFLVRLRPQRRFADVGRLVAQMQEDLRQARQYFAGG